MFSVASTLFSSLLLSFAVLAFRLERVYESVSNGDVYSSNWAGAFWTKDNKTFTSVTGTFIVPSPSGVNGSGASVLVSIDGVSCQTRALQTGILFTLSNETIMYNAWYEWYPDIVSNFTSIDIHAGDVIKLSTTVTSPSMMSGNVTIENLTNGQMVSKTLNSTYALCGQDAEWIVGDYWTPGGRLVPLANFTTVTFKNAEATGKGTYTPYGANLTYIKQQGQVLTSVSVDNSSVTIRHV